jgi:hypothetical protein
MIAPGSYAVLAPLMGGFLVGPRFLMGLLAGSITSGCMLAIMMANAGGAWDNSKVMSAAPHTEWESARTPRSCLYGRALPLPPCSLSPAPPHAPPAPPHPLSPPPFAQGPDTPPVSSRPLSLQTFPNF